ncbi:hypothetical protein Tco_0786342 [Tanacetum coccineum]
MIVSFGLMPLFFRFSFRGSVPEIPESFLCLVGITCYYDLDDNVYPIFLTDAGEEMDLFAFIRQADPTKVRIGERQIEEGLFLLLKSTRGRVIPLAGGNEQVDQHDNVEDVEPHNLDEGGGDAEVGDQTEESDRVAQDEKVNIVADDEVQAIVVDKPKGTKRKRKAAGEASGSTLPPKKGGNNL